MKEAIVAKNMLLNRGCNNCSLLYKAKCPDYNVFLQAPKSPYYENKTCHKWVKKLVGKLVAPFDW